MTQHSPTFNYFAAKLAGQNNLNDLQVQARQYIAEHYPEAKAGSNYCFALNGAERQNIPPTDMFFIRIMTFRSCIPPYTDPQQHLFQKDAENYVKRDLQLNNDDNTPVMKR